MQIYIDKIKQFLVKMLDPLKKFILSLNVQEISNLFFWLFVIASLSTSSLIYFIFIKTPNANSIKNKGSLAPTITIPTADLDKITKNLDNKKKFKPLDLNKDPFAL